MLGILFFSLGTTGFAGMSFLFPLLALPWQKQKNRPANISVKNNLSISVLIPAHNEEKQLPQTIQSIQNALHKLNNMAAQIIVGADSCTDHTKEVALQAGALECLVLENKSKWKSLLSLIPKAQGEWIAFVDSGALWPANLIQNLQDDFQNLALMAIAPSYEPKQGGRLEAIHWSIERFFKQLENNSCGPTSLHGATIFYRKKELLAALPLLAQRSWLNDDIAIPLALHIQFPEKKIHYFSGASSADRVADIGLGKTTGEEKRRIRMLLGNLEWMRILLPKLFAKNPAAFLIAQRRVFRVFWIYWLLFFLLGASLLSDLPLLNLSFFLPFVFLREAALASLISPYLLWKSPKEIPWA